MENTINPLLNKAILPGETFKIPSQGLFYTRGELHPEVKNGELYIKAMTAVDELAFKSPDLLYSGRSVEEVFSRCIPQVLKPRDLLSKDVDFLMLCLRMVTYGPELSITYDHKCSDESKEHNYMVKLQPIVQQAKRIDPTITDKAFSLTLPNGQVVRLKPTTFGAMLDLNQSVDVTDKVPSLQDVQTSVLSVLTDVIQSVDDVDNKEHIREWVTSISAGWVRMISSSLGDVGEWGAQMIHKDKCRDCGEEIEIEFSTNPVSFFS